MQKIVTYCVSTISCFSLNAQAPFNSDQFSMQLREIVSYAEKNFINVPENYVFKAALSNSIRKPANGESVYHAIISRNISADSAKKMNSF